MFGRRYKFKDLEGSATYAGGAANANSFSKQAVTVTGAALGDYAIASFSTDITDLQLDAQVVSANTVDVTFYNNTSGAVTPSGTVYVKVWKR